MAQYGFEWIKPYQTYYKFYIGQDGVARINASVLQSAGINMATLNPAHIQIFKNGKEQPVYVKGQDDGVFNLTDFVELYVEHNKGDLDSVLYATGNQPHQYYSLFSDTACYFLTILPDTTAVQPLRFTVSNDFNYSGYTPEDYFTDELVIAPTVEYLDGPNMASSELKYLTSDYEKGEGWAGARVGLGQSQTYSLNTASKYTGAGNASASIKVIGASDAVRNGSGQNHHVNVSVSSDNSFFTTAVDHIYAGYEQPSFTVGINLSNIGNTTYFRIESIGDLGVVSDFNSLSYITLNYPRTYNWNNSTFKRWKVLNTKGGLKTRLEFTAYGNGGQTTPTLLDFTTQTRINAFYASGSVSALIVNDGKIHDVVLFDSAQVISITQLHRAAFASLKPAGAQYIIITHSKLDTAATKYEEHRLKKYSVLKVLTEDLFDTYYYGVKHPLAIKQFASYLVKVAPQKPEYLLLLGKGYQNDKIRIPTVGVPDPVDYNNRNYVPVLGMPGADALYTAGITNDGGYPEVPIGRIPALNNTELQHYLTKLIYYETSPDSLLEWQKNTLHISGGNNDNEQQRFAGQINKNKTVIEGQFVGAKVISFAKNSSDATQANLKQKIIDTQNQGVTLLSFIGHASLTVLDVDIGSINELDNNLKYPFYYFNGCNVGNVGEVDVNGTGNIYGKDYLCAENKGAIGWLAHSNFTFDGTLFNMMDAFYSRYCNTQYRAPIGDIMKSIGAASNTADMLTKSHIIQWQLQGDPALILDNNALPDYKIAANDLYVTPLNVTVQEDSFAVNIIVTNLGKATSDSVTIAIKHQLPNGSIVNLPALKFAPVYYKDTFRYWVKYPDMKIVLGNNSLEVSIDYANGVLEGNEFNNKAVLSVFVAGSGVSALLPYKYEIVTGDSVTIIGQNNNILIQNASYIFELDTTVLFNSPSFVSSGAIAGSAIPKWKVKLALTDSQAYYWRVRLNVPVNEGGVWDQSSFTAIKNAAKGFAQVDFSQYTDFTQANQLQLDTITRQIEFTSRYNVVKAFIARWEHGGMGVLDPYFNTPKASNCIPNGTVCVLFDKETLKRTSQPNYPNNCVVNNLGDIYNYYAFNTATPAGQNEFMSFVDSVSKGAYIAAYSYYYAGADVWPQAMRDKLTSMGLTKVAAAGSFYNSFSFIAKKGYPLESVEDTIFDNSGFFQYDSVYKSPLATSERQIIGTNTNGYFETQLLGPAVSWNTCRLQFSAVEPNDEYLLKVFGVKNDLTDTLLKTGYKTSSLDLSDINAVTYPFIRLHIDLVDSINLTPQQPAKIMVTYISGTELAIDAGVAYSFYNKEVDQGDSLKLKVAISNISDTDADSVNVKLSIV
ncbi:MAG: C25 family cysteine peptidase, partial [Bacteroidota bacterium]